MRKLEYKHIAPYLQHNLKVKLSDIGIFNLDSEYGHTMEVYGCFNINNIAFSKEVDIEIENDSGYSIGYIVVDEIKPILRPLSQLLEEIECNGETFTPLEFFEVYEENSFEYINMKTYRMIEEIAKENIIHDVRWLPYGVVEKLIEWNFDINGLIEDGLAIKMENN